MPLSDEQVEEEAEVIFEHLKIFSNPQDAASIMILVQFMVIKASFEPEGQSKIIEAIDDQCQLLKELVNEGWQ